MATPKKKGKKRVPAKKKAANQKTVRTYEVKPDRYSTTFAVGASAIHDDPVVLQRECDGFFEYIKGEQGKRKVKYGKKEIEETYWIREPEPATITGLALYLGYSCLDSMDKAAKRSPLFFEIIKRAKLRVANRYERNLSGTTPTGAIFALKVMGWKDSTFVPEEGEGVVIGFQYVIPTKPKDNEE